MQSPGCGQSLPRSTAPKSSAAPPPAPPAPTIPTTLLPSPAALGQMGCGSSTGVGNKLKRFGNSSTVKVWQTMHAARKQHPKALQCSGPERLAKATLGEQRRDSWREGCPQTSRRRGEAAMCWFLESWCLNLWKRKLGTRPIYSNLPHDVRSFRVRGGVLHSKNGRPCEGSIFFVVSHS